MVDYNIEKDTPVPFSRELLTSSIISPDIALVDLAEAVVHAIQSRGAGVAGESPPEVRGPEQLVAFVAALGRGHAQLNLAILGGSGRASGGYLDGGAGRDPRQYLRVVRHRLKAGRGM